MRKTDDAETSTHDNVASPPAHKHAALHIVEGIVEHAIPAHLRTRMQARVVNATATKQRTTQKPEVIREGGREGTSSSKYML